MYAIIRDRTRQARVQVGDEILCDLMDGAEVGAQITFDEVLLVGHEGSVRVGKPTVASASVRGEVVGHGKGKKLIAFRFKRRKNVHRKQGHRQGFTRVKITAIDA